MKVLLALDPEANDTLPLAELSRAGLPSDCEVLVTCVADVLVPPKPEDAATTSTVLPVRAQAALDKAAALAGSARTELHAAFPTWSIAASAIADAPAFGILRKAEELSADLVMVGHQRQSVLARLTLGSVSQKVLHDARCSVRVVKRGTEDSGHAPRLLLATDGSEGANHAVTAITERSWPQGTLVRVVGVSDRSDAKLNDATLRERGQAIAQRLIDSGLSATIDCLTGDAKDTLLSEAAKWNADCIFVGARGLSAIERLLLGSVSGALAARATCSVEVVRPRR